MNFKGRSDKVFSVLKSYSIYKDTEPSVRISLELPLPATLLLTTSSPKAATLAVVIARRNHRTFDWGLLSAGLSLFYPKLAPFVKHLPTDLSGLAIWAHLGWDI